MMKNFKVIIEYDGSAYHGWQIQKGVPTIQGELEKALATMTGEAVRLTGAGRTDAGVHALGQVANFHSRTGLSPDALQKGLNSLLPKDIVIRACRPVDPGFHARFDARRKKYRYSIVNRPVAPAIGRQYAWHVRRPLDHACMRAVLDRLTGRHDFSAFEGAGSPRAHSIRTIFSAEVRAAAGNRLEVAIAADGFLRYMVRNIVGTAVAAGMGKLGPEEVVSILRSGDRGRAAATAPAHGLCLVAVGY